MNTPTTTAPTTKAGRRAAHLAAWYATCQQLCTEYGAAPTMTGKKLSTELFKLERIAYKAAEDYCNGPLDSEGWEQVSDATEAAIYKLLPGLVGRTSTAYADGEGSTPNAHNQHARPVVYINSDARGYALKLRPAEYNRLRDMGIRLEMDGGNNGILAPEINGDA